jgi:uncharacterized protein (UPF0332 family)
MITEQQKQQAKNSFDSYLADGLIKKAENDISKEMYLKNSELSLKVADELNGSDLQPHLWVIVCSYYSMFYAANAVLLHRGYQTQDKIAHQVTYDALIVLVLDRLKAELLEEFKEAQADALEIASVKADEILESYGFEKEKRSAFQYNMLETTKAAKAETSLSRAKEFLFEMKKLLKQKK